MAQDNTGGDSGFGDVAKAHDGDSRRCPTCGTSLADLYKDGRMGCAVCYQTFRDVVQRALIVLHGASTHAGKTL